MPASVPDRLNSNKVPCHGSIERDQIGLDPNWHDLHKSRCCLQGNGTTGTLNLEARDAQEQKNKPGQDASKQFDPAKGGLRSYVRLRKITPSSDCQAKGFSSTLAAIRPGGLHVHGVITTKII